MLKEKIVELKHQLIQDATLVEEMINKSVKGVLTKNFDLLEEVINTNEPRVNAFDRSIEKMCVELIAQFEPVAGDLRLVIMIIKMNKDLERMADHAVNISESGLFLLKNLNSTVSSFEDLKTMAESSALMLKTSIDAFVSLDVLKAQTVCDMDNIVDDLGDKILKDLTDLMKSKKDAIPGGLHVMRISHNLERIGDLATNIAEEVIYIVEGRDIKHSHGEGV